MFHAGGLKHENNQNQLFPTVFTMFQCHCIYKFQFILYYMVERTPKLLSAIDFHLLHAFSLTNFVTFYSKVFLCF